MTQVNKTRLYTSIIIYYIKIKSLLNKFQSMNVWNLEFTNISGNQKVKLRGSVIYLY